jgi:hypothetical protein
VTVSTQYNTTSILRTIEQILGLPPMNQFDALPVTIPLDQMNPDPKAIRDPAAKAAALASAAMNFAEIDKAPEDALNRVLWRAMRGSEPYPEWATSAAVEDDDDE